ncbi:hypothetical protein EG328_010635 [Venturia inaequalis]|uniref:Luciferase-like domain-containing protein n=1 Tax=Venturia inaequalis TaxID=5025 RepID=A0A8H3V647_VENIN|nr:hypothetical protein EG328_010635 [Venturia inaequalis]
MASGQWKSPDDNTKSKDTLEYYQWMAKLAEKGKITSIFFADVYGGHESFQGSMAPTFKSGSGVATLDPVVVVSAMAAVTKSVSFAITGSTSYIKPYIIARTWSTLDHMTRGRIAWNVVTSYSNSAAKAMGLDAVVPTLERYAAAQEFMELIYQLWEKSWDDGAAKWQASPEVAYDAEKIHRIEYLGKYHKFSGYSQVHPSPQRTPVLFQAGASKSGINFAGNHAEGIYTDISTIPELKAYTQKIRAAAVSHNRDPSTIKIFAGMMPYLGKTLEEAQAKYDRAHALKSVNSGMVKFSGYTGIDLSQYPIDEPFKFEGKPADNTITGVINNLKTATENDGEWTPRRLGELMALGGTTPAPVGTAEMVADVFEEWFRETDIDGFNIVYVSNPGSYEDVVELLVPELQRRGVYWMDYPVVGGTFRENLQGKPGNSFLDPTHPGAKYRKAKDGGDSANGNESTRNGSTAGKKKFLKLSHYLESSVGLANEISGEIGADEPARLIQPRYAFSPSVFPPLWN